MNPSATQATQFSDVSAISKSGSARRLPTTSPPRSKPVSNRLIKEEVMDVYAYSLDRHFIEMIMGGDNLNTEEMKQLLKEFILQPRFSHGEIIKEGEPYFRCLDCEILKNTNQRTYICRFCFEKSNHRGHRFLLFNDATGNETCDCGNEGLLDHRWFCPDHGTCTKDDYDRVISMTPPSYLKNLNKVIKQVVYELAFTCESYRRGMHTNTKIFMDKVMEALLAAIKYCLNLNDIFVVLIGEIISHAFKHPKNFKKRFYLIEGGYVKHNLHIIEENTKMTYLENIIRYSPFFREDIQKQLREILLRLACAEEFKKKLVVDFHKAAHHLFMVRSNTNFYFSNLSYLTTQIYASEENCLKVIKECTFDRVIDVLKQYAKNYEPRLDPEGEVLNRCLHIFELILEKEGSGRKLVEKEGVVGQFLDVITEFQKVHSYDVVDLAEKLKMTSHVDEILGYWDFEEQIFTIMERITKNVGCILDKIGWDRDPGLFLIDWGEKANQDAETHRDDKKIHLNIPIQRAMIAYLQNTLDRVDTEMIMKQLEYIRRACPEAIEHLIGQAVATIGAMRQCMIKLGGKNIEANPVTHRYFTQDALNDLSYFDHDFVFVQMFSLLLDEEEGVNLFELYYKNFFGHDPELVAIFETGDFERATEQQIQIFEDFFNFMIQLMHGEVSFFNIFYKNPYFTGHSSKKTLDQIHRKVLMTFLHKTYHFSPITDLKHDFRYMLRKDIFHEKILKDIADVDRESKTFKLKKPYRDLFDSFYLYPDRLINNKIILNVRTSNRRPEIAEVGNFSQNLPYLDIIQQRVYEGNIIEWLTKFLAKFTPKYASLITPITRIIILPLKLLERAKQLKLSRKFMEKSVFGFFGTTTFLELLKKTLTQIEDVHVKSYLAKLINIFIPRSNIGNSMNSFIAQDETGSIFDGLQSMDPSELHKALEAQNSQAIIPTLEETDENDLVCGLCRGSVDLTSEDVGIPTYISKSNVNYWELKGRKFRKPPQNADKNVIKLILLLIKRYYPYAEGLNAHDIDFADAYVPPRLKLDFYPALTSCMHYMHRSCFSKAYTLLPGSAQEFECPLCKKLNNTFIGMEKVDAASRRLLEEQIKNNKKFLGFLRKQGVLISMLPDPTLRFDFYNNFMHALFPKNSTLELRENDPAADRKILKFTSLMRTSYFQLVRNSMIYDFETFMNRSYMCYKFAFVNLQSFVMKNYQFHKFFEDFNKELAPTIFHVLNQPTLMEGLEPPTMKQLYDVYKEALGLEYENEVIKKKENTEKRKKKGPQLKPIEHHDHTRKLPKLPADSKGKPFQNFKMNRRNKQIMMAYNYNQNLMRMNELVFESQDMLVSMMNTHTTGLQRDTHRPSIDMTGTMDQFLEAGRSRGSTPDKYENYQEEELFDTLQKMMLLLESETEEDYLLAFWESFLRFLLTNRMRDAQTNIDIEMLPIDFLYLRSLGIFTRMLMSERMIKSRQNNLPDFAEMCKFIANNAELRNELVTELLSLTQRIIVSCILIFDFDKCLEVKHALQFLSDLNGDKEMLLNRLLGFLKKDLTINTILSTEIWDVRVVYKNFFYVWRENMKDFLQKTRNPFELFVKNTTEIKPLIIDLPSNFNEFNSEYLPKKCDICKEFCQACKTVICILCGKVMCKDKCLTVHHEKKTKKTKKGKEKDKNKEKKTPKKKKVKKLKVKNFGSLDSDSDSNTEASSIDFERELPEDIMTPVKPRALTPKGDKSDHRRGRQSQPSIGSVGSTTIGTKKPRIRSRPDITKESNIDIVTFNEEPSIEIGMAKHGRLSPIFSEDLVTPVRPEKPTLDYKDMKIMDGNMSADNKRINVRERRLKPQIPKIDHTKHAVSLNNGLSSRSSMGTLTPRPPTMDKLTMGTTSMGSVTLDTSLNDTLKTQKKKRRKRRKIRRGNMHKHAEECHKGQTVYIGVQDQNVILFSIPREVKYNEKLYADRFGQTLKDKVNMFEEDWNFFELNPFLLKKLREAVENHSLPQLVYALIKGDVKIN